MLACSKNTLFFTHLTLLQHLSSQSVSLCLVPVFKHYIELFEYLFKDIKKYSINEHAKWWRICKSI